MVILKRALAIFLLIPVVQHIRWSLLSRTRWTGMLVCYNELIQTKAAQGFVTGPLGFLQVQLGLEEFALRLQAREAPMPSVRLRLRLPCCMSKAMTCAKQPRCRVAAAKVQFVAVWILAVARCDCWLTVCRSAPAEVEAASGD